MNRLTKTRILVVDDESALRFLIEQVLLAEGYEVRTACNGEDAIKLASREHFDIVLTDLIMPGTDGIETILWLRGCRPNARIIAMSGGSKCGCQNYLPLAAKIGASQTLPKPFDRRSLLDAVGKEIETPQLLPA
jgi:two-component system, chemotaxis family, chemotaxis protein CheY